MSDATVAITAGTGTAIDVSSVTTGSGTVNRQRVVIGDDVGADGLAGVVSNHLQVTTADVSTTATLSAATTTATTGGNTTLTTPPIVITIAGRKSAGIVLSSASAWTVGTVSVYGSLDGTNYVPLDLYDEVNEKWITAIPAGTVGSWWVESLGAFKTLAVVTGAGWTGSVSCTLMASSADMHTPEWVAGSVGTIPIPNNAGLIGGSDGTNMHPISVDTTGHLLVVDAVTTTGGYTTFHVSSAASTNATNIKASAGQLYGWAITNTNAAIRYICFHNTAGTPTAGASIFFKFGIPGGGAANVFMPSGIPFSTGIGMTIVVNAVDTDATAVAANDMVVNLFYK